MSFDDTAKFFGASIKLWPELFRTPGAPKAAVRLRCNNVFEDDGTRCRRSREKGKQYCERCAQMRRRTTWRKASGKSRSDVNILKNSPIRAEALTNDVLQGRYNDSPKGDNDE